MSPLVSGEKLSKKTFIIEMMYLSQENNNWKIFENMRRLKNSEQVRAGNKYNQETSVAIPARQLPCTYRDEMDNQRQILIDKNFIEGLASSYEGQKFI